jgi:EmrB/QacA subfamily drug resistance transporter
MVTAAQLNPSARWHAFIVCIGVGALTILDLSGVNVALPSIQQSLHASSSELQLIVAGYTLAFGLALVPAGRLGDMKSRRTFFVIGLSAFVVASALCAVAPNDTWLTTARLIQGLAAGTQMPQVLGMNQQLFQGEERGRAFGIFGAMIGVATALGPTIGGLVIALGGETNGWRWLFAINIPLGIAAIIFSLRLLPSDQDHDNNDRELDPIGILLLGITIACLMIPFLLTTGKSDDPNRWFWLAGFVAGAVAFVLWERAYSKRGKSPIVHFDLFKARSFRNGILVASTYFAGMPAAFLTTTLFLQEGLKRTPLLAGLVVVPFAASSAVAAFIGGRLVHRFGRALVVVGIAIVAIGVSLVLLAAVFAPPATVEWFMAGGMLIGGIGGGLVISPNQTLTLSEIPPTQGSAAGSMAQLGQRVGTAIGVSAVTAVFFAAVQSGTASSLMSYRDAFRDGFFVTIGLLVLSFIIGLTDLWQRKRESDQPAKRHPAHVATAAHRA